MRTLATLLFALPLLAADSDFNGRWDITTTTRRAWWLEVTGAGTPHHKARPKSVMNPCGRPYTGMPLVIMSVIPETIESMPSVTISEGTRNSAEHSPLRRPTAAALPRLTTIPRAMAAPGSNP